MLRVAPNGMAALELIHPELPGLVAKAGVQYQSIRTTTCQEDGAVISDSETPVQPEQAQQAHQPVLISWHALQQVLASLLPVDVVRTSHAFHSFVENDSECSRTFQNLNTCFNSIKNNTTQEPSSI
jgi:NAD-dependent oxidoreductase involved in siderophore biosynthesis